MGRKRDKNLEKKIARSRIDKLFTMAEHTALSGKLNFSDRYVEIARKISMRYQIPIPRRFKRCFCKHCYSYMLPGVTCRVRVHRGRIVFYCFNCKKFSRFPIK
jgi:ribonuclease P protein subunit RPR2